MLIAKVNHDKSIDVIIVVDTKMLVRQNVFLGAAPFSFVIKVFYNHYHPLLAVQLFPIEH